MGGRQRDRRLGILRDRRIASGRMGGRYVRCMRDGRIGGRRVRVRGVYRFSSLMKQN
jgi:hypothetical protein